MITLSINLMKLDKSKFIEGKNGAVYANLVVWEKDVDQYGNNLSVQQSLTKEEREAKAKPIYVGDGKDWDKQTITGTHTPSEKESINEGASDLPF